MSIIPDNHDSGFFLALEGIDYCGKSSLCDFFSTELQSRKIPFARFRQPDRTSPYYKKILQFCKLPKMGQNPIDLAKIFIQERVLLSQKINIALAKKQFVICDRFDISTFAYQGGTGADMQSIWELHQYGQPLGTTHPHLTVYLDLPFQIALQRKAINHREKEIFDVYFDQFSEKKISFQQMILNYKTAIEWMQKIHPDRKFITIDATEPLTQVAKKILSYTQFSLDLQ